MHCGTKTVHFNVIPLTPYCITHDSTLKYFIKNIIPEPVVQLLQELLQFSNASPIVSRAGMISLPRCMGFYTKFKLVHWTLDVHPSCTSLLSFTVKNNSLNSSECRILTTFSL